MRLCQASDRSADDGAVPDWMSDHIDPGECTGEHCSEWLGAVSLTCATTTSIAAITRTDGDLTLNAEAMRSVKVSDRR